MKSSIKIDFIDRGTGVGIEPVIRIELIKSEDPRDTLIQVLFESLRSQSFLQLQYSNHKHVATSEGLPDMEKTILLFKPEIDTDETASIVRMAFCEWAAGKGWSVNGVHDYENGYHYSNKKKETTTDAVLFKQFLSEKATHTSA